MSILHGVLHLFEPTAPRGLRLPIDFFLRPLAEDRQNRSIGVILSGMGSDGTMGLRAIKEKAGLTLVQEPASAKFDSMPRSVISPPAELVNDKGNILYISGRTGKYLEPAAGKANWNIFAMAREGLRFDLGNAFQKALRQKEVINVKGLKVGEGAGTQIVDITV